MCICTCIVFSHLFAFRRVQANHEYLKLNGTQWLSVYANAENLHTIKNTELLVTASKEIILEVNAVSINREYWIYGMWKETVLFQLKMA
jgi:hypothetical protein